MREFTVVVPDIKALPCIERSDPGVVVPIPSLFRVLSQKRLFSSPVKALEELNWMAPLPPPGEAGVKQVPVEVLKQPADSWMPFAKVEDAVVEVTESVETLNPPEMVEVPVPDTVRVF